MWKANLCFRFVEECPCCQKQLWHCKKCWNKYHNGKRDKDWIAPAYPNQPLYPDDMKERMEEAVSKMFGKSVKFEWE